MGNREIISSRCFSVEEREVKFLVSDFSPYREALARLGAARKSAFFEDNIIFDDEQNSLRRKEKVLRLRKADRATLTLKTPVKNRELPDGRESQFKVREEYEIDISDFETAERIVTELGYRKTFRYQKNREVYTWGQTSVLLDHTPIGDYIEIEGDENTIRDLCNRLNLSLEKGITKNYMTLYNEFRTLNSGAPEDMVF
jgi:adenylate cyclase class 2